LCRISDQVRSFRRFVRPDFRLPGPAALTQSPRPSSWLGDLRAALAQEGLFVVHPLVQADLDRAGVAQGLTDLLPGAEVGLVIGDGGGTFFERFAAASSGSDASTASEADPLDRYTARIIHAVVAGVLGADESHAWAIRYPFDDSLPRLSVQALGRAAGLPTPGPLGIQIHPRFGPWWAYRALVLLRFGREDVADAPVSLSNPCTGCPAPCVTACPGLAVQPQGFGVVACAGHRLRDPGCHSTCVARRACIVAPEQGYRDAQLGFHMAASLTSVRRYFSG
jgi:hypothetical protein